MKGVVFSEFLEMVEQRYSLAVVDDIVQRAELPSGGVYTSVGTYPATEMVSLLSELSRSTGAPVPDLLRVFGRHLFHRFTEIYPQLMHGSSTFSFLENVQTVIHTEVKKLYPDAELPTFECAREGDERMTMLYRSPRRLSALAEGLMLGCAEHFGEAIDVSTEDLSAGEGEIVRFTITRSAST